MNTLLFYLNMFGAICNMICIDHQLYTGRDVLWINIIAMALNFAVVCLMYHTHDKLTTNQDSL